MILSNIPIWLTTNCYSSRVLKANIQGVASMDHFLPSCSISFGVTRHLTMAIAGVAAYKLKLWVVFKIQFECQAMISSHFTSRHPASRCFHSHRFQWKMQGWRHALSLLDYCLHPPTKNGVFKLEDKSTKTKSTLWTSFTWQFQSLRAWSDTVQCAIQNRSAFACHHSIVALPKDLAAKRGPDMP